MIMSNLEDDIKMLSSHEAFGRFIETIYNLREEAIASLYQAPTEQLQQTAGMILCYDQILQMVDWNSLQATHSSRLRTHL